MKGLEVLGVIEARSGSGLFVKSFSFDPIVDNLPYALQITANGLSDLLAVRVALEVGHAGIRSSNVPMLLRSPGSVTSSKPGRARRARPGTRTIATREFHGLLIARLDNALLAQLTQVFWTVSARALASDRLSAPRDPYETYLAHVPIVEAFEARDARALFERRLRVPTTRHRTPRAGESVGFIDDRGELAQPDRGRQRRPRLHRRFRPAATHPTVSGE